MQDSSAEIQKLLDKAGGSVKDLVASPRLLDEAIGHLNIKDRISIEMVGWRDGVWWVLGFGRPPLAAWSAYDTIQPT